MGLTWHTTPHTHKGTLDMIDMKTHTLKPLVFSTAFLSLFAVTVDDSGFMRVSRVPLWERLSLFSSSNLSLQEIKACFRLSQTGRGLWGTLGVLNLWSGCYIKLLQFMPDQKPSTATWDVTHASHLWKTQLGTMQQIHKWYDIIWSLAYLHCSSPWSEEILTHTHTHT